MPMSDEEAMNRAKVIVDKFDMSLRDHGQSAYAQLQAMIQIALIEASKVRVTQRERTPFNFDDQS
jgi:uncharacterized membrane protein YcaP (DUF421 family)